MKKMTSIAFRYIFKKLSVSLLIIAPIIIVLVWLTASLKYVNLIVVEDISVIAFLNLIACRLPDIFRKRPPNLCSRFYDFNFL